MVKQHATTNHAEIRSWAERHGFTPVEVAPFQHDSEPAMLAFATPDEVVQQLRAMSWDQFFALFAVQNLALVYDVGTEKEAPTDFYELVNNRRSSTMQPPTLEA